MPKKPTDISPGPSALPGGWKRERKTSREAKKSRSQELLGFSTSWLLASWFAMPNRSSWTLLTDAQLLARCEVDTYRASGPGGQKRNKTSSAVRLRHEDSGLSVIAEESRSQHENKAK